MKIDIDGDFDERTARAIITAVSQHLGEPIELNGTKETQATFDEAVITDREESIREDIEEILSGGPERGFKKIEELGKLFVRERMDLVFDDVHFENGTFAGLDNDNWTPADGLITGIGTIDGREVYFSANDYTVKAGSIGNQGIEKQIRLSERAVEARSPIIRLIDSTGARLTPGERDETESHADRYTGGKSFFNQ